MSGVFLKRTQQKEFAHPEKKFSALRVPNVTKLWLAFDH